MSPEDLDKIEKFYRFLDVDGDGIAYRTIPGEHPKGAYFTRGSGHTKYGAYTEESEEYLEVLDRVCSKIESAASAMPAPRIRSHGNGRYALVTLGGCDGGVREAIEVLEAEGDRIDYLRIRGFPFSEEVVEFLENHELNIVIEQNRDAQLLSLLTIETSVAKEKLASVTYYGGLPMSAHHVITGVKEQLELAGIVSLDGVKS